MSAVDVDFMGRCVRCGRVANSTAGCDCNSMPRFESLQERDVRWALAERDRAEQALRDAETGYQIGRDKFRAMIDALRKEKEQLETTLATLTKENENLRYQIVSIKSLTQSEAVRNACREALK